jgi:cytochrome c-type biogenesis protein CcmE
MGWALAVVAGAGTALALALSAIGDGVQFFRPPAELAALPAQPGAVRLGGLVEAGSVRREIDGEGRPLTRFRITDGRAAVEVAYRGVLPDLFREGQGTVAVGRWDGMRLDAWQVLARHDETYMPPEVAAALQASGAWNPAAGAPPPPRHWNGLGDGR